MLDRITASLPSLAPAEQRVGRLVLADARATAAQPVARAAGRIGSGRVRVELAGEGRAADAARPAPSAMAADAAASVLTPVLFTVPTLSADVRVGTATSGS